MRQICCLKIPVPTRWGSILNFWTILKSKNVLKRLAINEEMTYGKTLSASAYETHLYIARYAAALQPPNEVFLLIFYKCSFSEERSVLPEDGRITETCRSQLVFYCFRHFKLNKINIKHICW
jgi:hypothetical protein